MPNLFDVLTEVYELYPRGIFLCDEKYKKSKQYLNMNSKKKNAKESQDLETISQDMKVIFENYEVVNWSNIEEHPSYEFVILLHKNQPILDDDTNLIDQLDGVRYDLLLYISCISNYYCYYVRETRYSALSGDWSFKKIELEDNLAIVELIHNLNVYLTKKDYQLLPQEILSYKLPDIDLDLINFGEVTVFHCLFTDLLDFIIKE